MISAIQSDPGIQQERAPGPRKRSFGGGRDRLRFHPARRSLDRVAMVLVAVLLCSLLGGRCAFGEEAAGAGPGGETVTQPLLESKIEGIEAAGGLDDEAKTRLVDLYRKALGYLQTAASNTEAADAFRRAAQTAPAQTQAIREDLKASSGTSDKDLPQVPPSATAEDISKLLQKEKADLAASDTRLVDLERQLAAVTARPALARQRLDEAKDRQGEIGAELKLPPPTNQAVAVTEATRWVLTAHSTALGAEIKMLEQELATQQARVEVLEAKRDQEAANLARIGGRVKALEDLVNQRRQDEAQQAKDRADAARRDAEGKHPLVMELAERNALLTRQLADMAAQIADLTRIQERTESLEREIQGDFDEAQETMAIGGLNQDLGHFLLRQRQSLPDLRSLRRQISELESRQSAVGLQRLNHRAEMKEIREPEEYVQNLAAEQETELTPGLGSELSGLVAERRALLAGALDSDDLLIGKLGELDAAEGRLIKSIKGFDAFLDEHLLWVRSGARAHVEQLGTVPEQMWRILSPNRWIELARTLLYQATHTPLFAALAILLGILLWHRKRLLAEIRATGERLGKPTTDRIGYSIWALVLSLVVASTWPLVFVVTGWALKLAEQGSDFSSAVAESLLLVATQYFYLRALRVICMRGGLAAAHFRWPEASLRVLRVELDRLTWIFIPGLVVTVLAHNLDPLYEGWEVGRVAGAAVSAALTFALFRLLHPKRGALAGFLRHRESRVFRHLYVVGYWALVATPLVLTMFSLLGFRYTAVILFKLLLETGWLTISLIVLHALAVRWLLVARRRLAYEAAVARRQATLESREAEAAARGGDVPIAPEVDEPEVDLVALSDATRELLNVAFLFSGVVGLLMIWAEVFPAFRVLNDINLWQHSVTIGGEARVVPVTLADVGLALVYAAVTVMLAKQLPAVLEIILLRQTQMSAGSRYTATTLTNYAVIIIGVVLVFKTLGTDWSKLQWLVAALGVGVGFGLQEIVANFISGLIILFERPVRVGDVVTVGDTDGTVTRIRIRATTIKTWDGKELLVPNKEFITDRLLNWSLSDQTTRILISVGIAYGANVRLAMRLLEEAAREHLKVLSEPAPSVIFEGFGDNALTMVLRCFVDSVDVRMRTVSELNQAINDKFMAAGISIAFPQRDLHLDTTRPLQVEIRSGPGLAPSPGRTEENA